METVTQENNCRRHRLAQQGPFMVESCGCGMIHLSFGFLTVRIAPAALEALCATLLEAVEKFERPKAQPH